MHTHRPSIGLVLGLGLVLAGLAGCGSNSPAGETPPAFVPSPTSGTQTNLEVAFEDDDLAELDPTLAEIEQVLAELDQFLNETAFVMEAEEGEFTP